VPRFLLTPRWLAFYTAVVAAVVACLLLGWWQLGSYRERLGPTASVTRSAPVPLAEVVEPGRRLEPAAVGRDVTVSGTYDADRQLLVPGRRLDDRAGYLVLTPLRTDDGAAVPVRRGWVPAPDDPALAVPAGRVTVTGVLQPPETDRGVGVDVGARLPAGQVPLVALSELAIAWPYPPTRIVDGYIALTAQDPPAEEAPVAAPAEDVTDAGISGWRSLSYAGQWWLFAVAALAFWASAVRNAATTARSATNDANGTVPASSTSAVRVPGQRSL